MEWYGWVPKSVLDVTLIGQTNAEQDWRLPARRITEYELIVGQTGSGVFRVAHVPLENRPLAQKRRGWIP